MRFLRDAALAIVLFVIVLGVAGLLLARRGFSARAEPSAVEQFLATRIRNLAIPSDAKKQANPFAGDPDAWRAASRHFEEHCAVCHGSDGRGMTVIGRNLYPKAPDMAGADTQRLSDGDLFYIISNGIRFTGMPGWGGEDSAEEIWQLVSFIRHLPTLKPEELEQLKSSGMGGSKHSEGSHGQTPHTHSPRK
jgi:mono/diheme cytochrome c family protein